MKENKYNGYFGMGAAAWSVLHTSAGPGTPNLNGGRVPGMVVPMTRGENRLGEGA